MAKLSPKESAFISIWKKNGFKASEAYRIAYKYEGKNADALSYQAMVSIGKKVDLEALKKQAVEKVVMEAQDVLSELTLLGTSDIGELSWRPGEKDSQGNDTIPNTLKPLNEMPKHIRRCISSFDRDETGKIKIRLWDKNTALTNMGRFYKLLTDKVELSGKLSWEEVLEDAAKKDGDK